MIPSQIVWVLLRCGPGLKNPSSPLLCPVLSAPVLIPHLALQPPKPCYPPIIPVLVSLHLVQLCYSSVLHIFKCGAIKDG